MLYPLGTPVIIASPARIDGEGEPMDPLRVVFLGTPQFAVPSLEGIVRSGADLRAVVCQPDRPKGRGLALQPPPTKVWAQENDVPVHQPVKVRNGSLRALLEPYRPDVLVVTAYGRILPPEVLELPQFGALNGHASLLPKYRGAAPIQWAIARGEKTTGVTVMQMDEGLDTGDMILTRELPIGDDDTAIEVHDALSELSGVAIEDALTRLRNNGSLPRTPQDHAQATLAPLLKKSDGYLDLTLGAEELTWRIRGFQPWPGAVLWRHERPLKVFRAQVGPSTGAKAGTIVHVGDTVDVETSEGVLKLEQVQPEGKRRMPARDWAAGARIAVGDAFDTGAPGA